MYQVIFHTTDEDARVIHMDGPGLMGLFEMLTEEGRRILRVEFDRGTYVTFMINNIVAIETKTLEPPYAATTASPPPAKRRR